MNQELKIVASNVSDGNMSHKSGLRDKVDKNHERFFAKHGINPNKIVYMEQVHGDRIGVVKRPQMRKKTDGLITKTSGLWLAVYHADCIPLFFTGKTFKVSGEMLQAIGVAHVGWRGAAKGLPAKMVGEMAKHFKVKPENVSVKFGAFICKDHYDVAVDDGRLKSLPYEIKGDRAYVDLKKSVTDQLIHAGILTSNLLTSNLQCTAENPELYWSFHRQGENLGGVMLSLIGIS